MPSFLPIDINKTAVQVSNVTNALPPSLSSKVGINPLAAGQAGNNPIIAGLQNLAKNQLGGDAGNFLSSLIQQGSAFPYKKPVSFILIDRNGKPVTPVNPAFAAGYFFKMFVNPSNMTINYPAKTVSAVRTLSGWKLHHWYPEIGGITADGIIGNMLERYNRDLKDSVAWKSFKQLISIYQNNGIPVNASNSNQGRINLQNQFAPTVGITFDKVTYYGYFENFTYVESEDTPHTIKYNFSFKFLSYADLEDIPGLTREGGMDREVGAAFDATFQQAAQWASAKTKF